MGVGLALARQPWAQTAYTKAKDREEHDHTLPLCQPERDGRLQTWTMQFIK